MSNLDIKLGIHSIATIFGLTYRGFHDPEDNGIGAFEDPETGRLYRTANKTLVGVSIPIPFYEQTPDVSRADIENGVVSVTLCDHNGLLYENLKIVDLGPGKHDRLLKDKSGYPHLLDRTYALCAEMKSFDDALVTYWLMREGEAIEIYGQETPYVII